MIRKLKEIYKKSMFEPSFFSPFINPFYFTRKAVWDNMVPLSKKLHGKILDVGCGNKPYQKLLNYVTYVGLEIDTEENRQNKNADYFYDGLIFPFENSTFDSLISTAVFEHVFEPDIFLSEINRVLVNGGYTLLAIPFVWDEHEQPYDFGRYTSFGLIHLLEKHGFEIIELRKSANNFSSIVQIFIAYLHKSFFVKNIYINLALTLLIIAPINLVGIILSLILPKNNDFYLSNVVLARKISNDK